MPYDVDSLTGKVRTRIRDQSYAQPEILDYLNDAQRELFNRVKLRQMEEPFEGTLTIGEHSYELRPGSQEIINLIIVDPDDETKSWNIMDRYMDFRTFDKMYPNPTQANQAQPYCWTEGPGGPNVRTSQIFFSAPVDKAYIMRAKYTRRPIELVNITDVPELPEEYQELLVLSAAARCMETRDKWDEGTLFRNRYEDLLTDAIRRESRRQSGKPIRAKNSNRVAVNWGW